MQALVGSRALAIRGVEPLKPFGDFDFIASNKSVVPDGATWVSHSKAYHKAEDICEWEIAVEGSSAELFMDLVKRDAVVTSLGLIPSVDMLFTLKSSHKHLKNSPHFWKTFIDYHRLRNMGAKVRPEYTDFLKLREKETYAYKHPFLMRSKNAFFSGDGVDYTYDHDSIHLAMAAVPAYTHFQDGAVWCSKSKFDACAYEIKLASVVEETCVLAIERSLVPHPGAWTPKQAWKFALSKVLSSITSGWWRAWAYENGLEVLKAYPVGYWERFQTGLASGTVKRASI